MNIRRVLCLCVAALVIGGCTNDDTEVAADVVVDVVVDKAPASIDLAAVIATAIGDARRPADDVARDAGRNPQALLEFAGIAPGMNVLDMFAGGGYYTELATYIAGTDAKVVAYNNMGYGAVAGEAIASRYADGRLANVEQLTSNELALPASTFDLVLFVLCYHDVYYLENERGWVRIDRPQMLKTVFNSVKSGGKVVVADHVARAGLPLDEVKALHRIDPELIKADFQAAGFSFDGESDVLRNPDDDFDVIAMAPHVRGKTDRAVLRFVKP
jgi:predicted methyltransferase